MKFKTTVEVKQPDTEVVFYKKRTFFQWLFNKEKEIEKILKYPNFRHQEITFDSLNEFLKYFLSKTLKGKSSGFCYTNNGICFYMDKGKSKITIQDSQYDDKQAENSLKELKSIFGEQQTIDGKTYQIKYNVVNVSKLNYQKNKGG